MEFNPAENAILLNGKAAPLGGEAVTAVVYDTVLGRPLESASLSEKGRVEFNPAENAILLNGKAAPLGGEAVTAVVYDTVLGRPLESASLSESLEFTHREFTSDLLPQYR